ncbi:MAG: hypothetical protein GF320_17010 [Armatimonadia bacterium]|nr:hypothetical protein [Armatimonadia bacterium]
MPSPRLIVIGLDGATLDLIRPWAAAGKLPVLASLMQSGTATALRSTLPPVTPVAWSTFLTGAGPGQHGIYSFHRLDHDSYKPQPVHAGHRRLPSFWQSLGAAGLTVGQLNTPFTFPPEELTGFTVSGFDTPAFGPGAAAPTEAYEVALHGEDGYRHGPVPLHPRESYILRLRGQAMGQARMCGRLLDRWPCQVLMTTFCATDHAAHRLWPTGASTTEVAEEGGDLLAAYQVADEAVGQVLEAHAGNDTGVLVLSDHGMGPAEGSINMTRVLADAGLLKLRSRAEDQPAMPPGLRAVRAVRRFFAEGAGRALKPLALRLMPERAKAAVAHTELQSIDWGSTYAFPWGTYGQIQINRAGEWAEGVVEPADERAIRRDVAQAFEELVSPSDGSQVVERVVAAEELYPGERAPGSPDLLLTPEGYRYDVGPRLQRPDAPTVATAQDEGGEWLDVPAIHRLEGTLIATGPAADRVARLADPGLEHMAGVILELAGVGGDSDHTSPPGEAQPYTEEQARQVEQHLEDLGYL